jgi:signal transduction histidine kinase
MIGHRTESISANVSKALEELVALYIRKIQFKKISLQRDFGNDISLVGYPGEMRQIFANLISNAIEALPEAGCLKIRASRSRGRDGSGREGVRITFLDNGAGITPDHRQKIFEPFFYRQERYRNRTGIMAHAWAGRKTPWLHTCAQQY